MMKSILFRISGVVFIAVLVAGLSYASVTLKSGDTEKKTALVSTDFTEETTLEEIGRVHKIDRNSMKEVFGLQDSELIQTVKSLNLPIDSVKNKIRKAQVLAAEHASKNWLLILVKFVLWIVFLIFIGLQLKRKSITPFRRKIYLGIGVVLFGITLGADPSPMGTVKDAIVLFAAEHVIFPPRLVAFLAMLVLGTILANKILCSWGCQFGTLQDFIFRLGRDKNDQSEIIPQVKIPFILTNSIRLLFFGVLIAAAVLWSVDIVAPIDPFAIFKPMKLAVTGAVFIGVILLMSLFVYRPWCHFFCPFGLVGWMGEKVSIFKIKVNYDTCISCKKCAKACPSTVMNAILVCKKIIPDCFACGTCIETCPTKSISFASGKRQVPPAGKFDE
jgi:polyferredoxin